MPFVQGLLGFPNISGLNMSYNLIKFHMALMESKDENARNRVNDWYNRGFIQVARPAYACVWHDRVLDELKVPAGVNVQNNVAPEVPVLLAANVPRLCVVCMEEVPPLLRVDVGCCQSSFHRECLYELTTNYDSRCPVCRTELRVERPIVRRVPDYYWDTMVPQNQVMEPADAGQFLEPEFLEIPEMKHLAMLDNPGNREYTVLMRGFTRPALENVGWSTGVLGENNNLYHSMLDYFRYSVGRVQIQLPASLVDELEAIAISEPHNEDGFKIVQNCCVLLLRPVLMNSRDYRNAILWGPVLAWERVWKKKWQIRSLVSGKYFDFRNNKFAFLYRSVVNFGKNHPYIVGSCLLTVTILPIAAILSGRWVLKVNKSLIKSLQFTGWDKSFGVSLMTRVANGTQQLAEDVFQSNRLRHFWQSGNDIPINSIKDVISTNIHL